MSTETQTKVEQVDINLDELLGTPGAENVMLPDSQKVEKPNIFTTKPVNMDFINEVDNGSDDGAAEDEAAQDTDEGITIEDIIKDVENDDPEKIVKPTNSQVFKKLIEKGSLSPFDDDKSLDEYTDEDWEELFEANLTHKQENLQKEFATQFFESLPTELQYATKYIADGGTDLKGLFRALSEVEETADLSVEKESDQKKIIRNYLTATNFGTSEEIEEEITDWNDRGLLGDKAAKFKPKLDKMQEQVVAQKLAQQQEIKNKKEFAARKYMENVHKTLSKAELNGLKLDKNTQALLYNGLVQPAYPSISGKPTNLLGHLLEKYQYVEPRHDLIAEALWLLTDPEGFKSKVMEKGSKAADEKTVRQIKIEQSTKSSNTPVILEESNKQTKIPRAQKNIFARS
jgi:hypothetical protein